MKKSFLAVAPRASMHGQVCASVFLACFAASAVLAGDPARAIDGQILITQEKALAGNVTLGDTAGYPVTISRQGSYKLATNLKVTAGKDGVSITSSNVTIDLNGWRIFGSGQARHGISATDTVGGVSIQNGNITSFKGAGVIGRGHAWLLKNLDIDGGESGILAGDALMVIDSRISSRTTGIICKEACHVHNSSFRSNGQNGVIMRSGLVTSSDFRYNGGYAIASFTEEANSIGFGDNIMIENNGSGAQVQTPSVAPVSSNVCKPEC